MPGVEEGMIVSTCNRVEIMARATDGQCDLQGFVREYYGFDPGEYERISSSIGSARPSGTSSAWPPAWIRWWWASRRSWAR